MSTRLDSAELKHRLRGQASELIVHIASLLQGGILSAAAFSLIDIFKTTDEMPVRLMLWLLTVTLGFVIYVRLCRSAVFHMHAGVEILIMLPLICLFEIIPFAILSSTALGPESWRYWYVADTLLFATGVAINLRSVRQEHYAEDAFEAMVALRASIRRQRIEGIAATLFTAALTAWVLVMPPRWPYTTAFVAAHLVLTIVLGILVLSQDLRETSALHAKFAD